MMTVVLSDDALRAQFPESCIMIRTGCHQVRRVRTERTVPHPALMPMESRLERKGIGVLLYQLHIAAVAGSRPLRVNGPDARGVIGTACCEMAHVRREEHACDVCVMCDELADRYEGSNVSVLDHAPDIDIALTLSVSS